MCAASSPKIFTDFMPFAIPVIRSDRPNLYHTVVNVNEVDASAFRWNTDFSIKDSKVSFTTLLNRLDDVLGGLATKAGA